MSKRTVCVHLGWLPDADETSQQHTNIQYIMTTVSEINNLRDQAWETECAIDDEIAALYSPEVASEYKKARTSERKLSKFFGQTHGNWKTMGCGRAPEGSIAYLMSLHLKAEKASTLRFSCEKVVDALIRK